jgi:hypothetical protein
MLTVSFLRSVLDHALDTDNIPSGGVDVVTLINLAGRQMMNMAQWKWADVLSEVLDLVEDQEWVELPSNTLRVISIQRMAIEYPVRLVAYRTLDELRKNGLMQTPVPSVFAAVEYVTPSGGGQDRIPRLAIYPAPADDVTGAIRATIQPGWTPVVDDNDVIDMPAFMEPLFLEVLKATGQGWYESDAKPVDVRIAELMRGPIFLGACMTDGMVQPDAGPIANSAVDMAIREGNRSVDFFGGIQELPS